MRDFFYNTTYKLTIITAVIFKPLPYALRCFLFELFSGFPGKLGCFIRYVLLGCIVNKLGKNVYVGRWVTVKGANKLTVGDNVSFHDNVYIDAQGELTVGDNVSIAHASSLVSFDHTWQDNKLPIKYNPLVQSAIKIDNDVWVGCGVRVLSGVSIPSRMVIAAGSVVTSKSIVDDKPSLYAGVPARKVKKL